MIEQTLDKISFLETYPDHYVSSTDQVVVTKTAPLGMLSINYEIPFSQELFDDALTTLQGLAFSMKFALKRNPPKGFFDYNIPPIQVNIQKQHRTISLPQPEYITAERVLHTRRVAQAKTKQDKLPQIDFVSTDSIQVAQKTHIGIYDTLPETIDHIQTYATQQQLSLAEVPTYIYLNDLRRTKPEELETIVRFEIISE